MLANDDEPAFFVWLGGVWTTHEPIMDGRHQLTRYHHGRSPIGWMTPEQIARFACIDRPGIGPRGAWHPLEEPIINGFPASQVIVTRRGWTRSQGYTRCPVCNRREDVGVLDGKEGRLFLAHTRFLRDDEDDPYAKVGNWTHCEGSWQYEAKGRNEQVMESTRNASLKSFLVA